MSRYPYEMKDRAFLHDLATPIAILKFHCKRLLHSADGSAEKTTPEIQLKLLQQMVAAIEKIEKLHADQKSEIHLREAS